MSAIGRQPQHDAPAGISIVSRSFSAKEPVSYTFMIQRSPFSVVSAAAHTISVAWGSSTHSACSITRCCSVSAVSPGQHLYRLLQQDGAAVCESR